MKHSYQTVAVAAVATTLASCAGSAKLPFTAGVGANPSIPKPERSLIPTVNVAKASGWSGDARPVAANGLAVAPFATGLVHPRWLYVLPNGDILVAETNAPPRPDGSGGGIREWLTRKMMKKAGAGMASPNRITLLRDANQDGVAELHSIFVDSLFSPFGMALIDSTLYVANADGIVSFHYAPGDTSLAGRGTRIIDLPAGLNHHWTKNILASADGSRLYATVGSNSNAAENGMRIEEGRAAIWEIDLKTRAHRIFASGLRNPNGLAWIDGTLWTVVNERDELGSDLVPDYLTSVTDGAFYGWPYSYFGQHVDDRVTPKRPDLVEQAIVPDYALGTHVAALGLTDATASKLSDDMRDGVFIGMHGSWNRKPVAGYKVVFVPFANGKPSGMPVDVLTGFLADSDHAHGRPVGVVIDASGALLVADDVGNTIWRVTGVNAHTPR